MRKLLTANFFRLRRDRFFWCVLVVAGVFSLVNILNSVQSYEVMLASGYMVSLDDYYFNQAPLMGAFYGLVISMFLGTEYADGGIRNKLVAGHKRRNLYLGNFVTCAAASAMLLACWLLVGALGFIMIGPMEMGLSGYVLHIVVAFCIMFSFVAVFTFVGSLSANKAMTIVYTIVVFLLMAIAASGFYDRLCEPEVNTGMTIVDNQLVPMEPTPNPLYLTGTTRLIWQCGMELLPSGQSLLLSDASLESPIRGILLSVVFTTFVLIIGCGLFCKKDIK